MSDRCPESVAGLDVHEVEDGFVVYDASTDRVHYLNPTASVVLSFCDGARDAAAIAGLVQDAWQLDAPPTDEVVACVDQLRREGVVR